MKSLSFVTTGLFFGTVSAIKRRMVVRFTNNFAVASYNIVYIYCLNHIQVHCKCKVYVMFNSITGYELTSSCPSSLGYPNGKKGGGFLILESLENAE